MLEPGRHPLPFASVSLRSAALFLGLLAFGDKEHFLAKRLGNPLGNDTFIKASNQLLDRLAFTSIYMHSKCIAIVQPAPGSNLLIAIGLTPFGPYIRPRITAGIGDLKYT